jgi:predicted RNase H-like nuclease (RuvC/YqgF family)
MNHFEKGKNREEKIDKFLDILSWYFSEKTIPTGLYSKIGKIEERIDELNKQLTKASESSEKLTKALNRITLAGVIIAGIGLFIALASLCVEIYKIFFLK